MEEEEDKEELAAKGMSVVTFDDSLPCGVIIVELKEGLQMQTNMRSNYHKNRTARGSLLLLKG